MDLKNRISDNLLGMGFCGPLEKIKIENLEFVKNSKISDMVNKNNSRRKFIHKCIAANGLLLGGGWLLGSCSSGQSGEESTEEVFSGDPCENMSDLSESELAKRKQLGYVEKSPIPESVCSTCQLYIPPKTDKDCGGCMLFKGPVYSDAYCTYWAPQV